MSSPGVNFTVDPPASEFAVSQKSYLDDHKNEEYNALATGAIVFDHSASDGPRILLLQRSAGDSMPNKWEIPGGGCDDEDESILHSVSRELWEETGLRATQISGLVGEPHFFRSRSGKKICKFHFVIRAETNSMGDFEVKLDPKEHQRFIWATLEEVGGKRVKNIELDFTTRDMEILIEKAFTQIKKE